MNYDEVILRDLLNIYERRDANSSSFKTRISIKLNKDKYPKYFLDVEGYDEAIKKLESKNYITVKYIPHDTVIDSISLNTLLIDKIKEELNIEGVSSLRDKLITELNKYDDEIIINLKNKIEARISENKSIKQYLNLDFIDAIKAVHYMENLNHDVFIRNASNFIYNDSKRLATLKSVINSIYGEDDAFFAKGIMSVPSYLYVKGEGIITVNNEELDLKKLSTGIGISLDNIDGISFKNITSVTTVENLTTFYNYEANGLIIYLGGFSNKSLAGILLNLKNVCQNFYHFGDIDYGGFSILNNLMEILDLDIKAINMDLETLKKNEAFALAFNDEAYLKKLNTLLLKPRLKSYYDVIEYMIKKRIWLEQESFYNS